MSKKISPFAQILTEMAAIDLASTSILALFCEESGQSKLVDLLTKMNIKGQTGKRADAIQVQNALACRYVHKIIEREGNGAFKIVSSHQATVLCHLTKLEEWISKAREMPITPVNTPWIRMERSFCGH
jgi:hypothetical protein